MQDFTITNAGSIHVITPLTERASTWLRENTHAEGWQWLGASLAIEPRYSDAIVDGMLDAGLVLA